LFVLELILKSTPTAVRDTKCPDQWLSQTLQS
jgi:hypothetical protein